MQASENDAQQGSGFETTWFRLGAADEVESTVRRLRCKRIRCMTWIGRVCRLKKCIHNAPGWVTA